MRALRMSLVLAIIVTSLAIAPAPALAEAPPAGPMTIRASYGFETGYPTDFTTALYPYIPGSYIYPQYLWGSNSRAAHSGSYSLWCAGKNGTADNSFMYSSGYDYNTGSFARLDLPQLANYYSAELDFWYLLPSRGVADTTSFRSSFGPDADPANDYQTQYSYSIVSAWTKSTHDITVVDGADTLSRKAGVFKWLFINFDEGGATPAQGIGASIDDLVVTGYKYGPVRDITTTSTATGVKLDWKRPYKALGTTTLEERVVSYRVWRQPQTAPTDPWTELTEAARITTTGENVTYTDTTAVGGVLYRYLVVVYDGGTGTGYGELTETVGRREAPPAAPVMTALSSSSHPAGTWASASGVALAWSATGTDITGYGLAFDQSAGTTVSTQNTVATSGTGTATSSGTWYAHVAAKDSANQWSSTRHLQVLVDQTKPVASDDAVPAGYEGTATVTLSATDAHSGVSAIDYQIDAGAPVHVAGSSASLSISTPGVYTVSYTAQDNAGNTSVAKDATVWVRALPPPAVPVVTSLASVSHPAGVWGSSSSVGLAWSATGTDLTGYGLVFDQSAVTTVSAQTTVATSGTGTAASSGTWYAHVAAKDAVNQWSSTRHLQVLVDRTLPTASDDAVPAGYEGTATVTLSATDAHSGVSAIDYQVGAGAPVHVAGSSASFSISTPGTYTVSYTAQDNAGNTSLAKNATVWVRAVVPPDRGIYLSTIASPLELAASQTTTFTYTLRNTGDVDITDVALTDGGVDVPTGITTLAANETRTVTRQYVAAADLGFHVFDARVTGDAGGTPVEYSSSVGVQVHTPKMSVSVAPATRGVSAGKQAVYRVSVTNAGDVALNLSGTLTHGATTTLLSASTVAAGSSVVLWGSVPAPAAGTGAVTAAVSGTCGSGTSWQSTIAGPGSASATLVPARFFGLTRTATAVELSKAAFPSGASNVVVATAFGYADALSASALAASVGGPLLLVRSDGVPAEVLAELDRLNATKAYVIGGTAAVSDAAANQLTAAGLTVQRVAGATRYDTAKKVSEQVDLDATASKTVFLATGTNFPDALAASSLAAAMKAPIMLTRPTDLPAETLVALKAYSPTRVVVVGGTGAVSDGVLASVRTQLGLSAAATPRLAGTSRYETAKKIIDWGRDTAGLAPDGIDGMYLASGTNYPDALAGGVFAAKYLGRWRPLMLTNPTAATPVPEVQMLVTGNPLMGYVSAIGGLSALPQSLYDQTLGYLP